MIILHQPYAVLFTFDYIVFYCDLRVGTWGWFVICLNTTIVCLLSIKHSFIDLPVNRTKPCCTRWRLKLSSTKLKRNVSIKINFHFKTDETWYFESAGKNLFAVTSVTILSHKYQAESKANHLKCAQAKGKSCESQLQHQVLFYYGLIVLSSLKSHNSSVLHEEGWKEQSKPPTVPFL